MFLSLLKNILKIIFPHKCILCEKVIDEENSLCANCWEKIKFIQKPFCCKCSTPLEFEASEYDLCLNCLKNEPLYIKSRSAVIYNHEVARILFRFKFYDKIYLKSFIAKSMIKHSEDILNNIDILIAIPMHKKRLIFRKYNQSLLLAKEIAKITGKKIIYNFLYKTEHTKPQASLRQKDRLNNLKGKFLVNKKYLNNIEKYKDYNFAIIDDVMTTGSTINECVKVLNDCGIKNVYAITFAKTVKNSKI